MNEVLIIFIFTFCIVCSIWGFHHDIKMDYYIFMFIVIFIMYDCQLVYFIINVIYECFHWLFGHSVSFWWIQIHVFVTGNKEEIQWGTMFLTFDLIRQEDDLPTLTNHHAADVMWSYFRWVTWPDFGLKCLLFYFFSSFL